MDWDCETDVIVIGYGCAGGIAAITAHDSGASVLILEKMSEPGGASRTSGGRMRIILDAEKCIAFLYGIFEGTTPRDVIEVFVRGGLKIPEWIGKLGGELERVMPNTKVYPRPQDEFPFPGIESFSYERQRVKGLVRTADDVGGGANIMTLLIRNVTEREIKIFLETPVTKLIRDNDGVVIGVEARSQGKTLLFKARRGIVLACGGFGADRELLKSYTGYDYFEYYCNPGSTGDGIKMAMEIGADLWHMPAVVAGFAYKVPDYEYPIRHRLFSPGFIYVDQNGHRFMNETGVDSHWMWSQVNYLDVSTMTYPRVPCVVIFDDDTFRAGPVGSTAMGKIGDVYQWSEDNHPELGKGWIIEADTIDGLAKKIDLRVDILQETVSRYNHCCIGGYDHEYNRRLQTLTPIIRPPFYAMKIYPTLYNTLGGPKRDSQARVLNIHGQPISRLYSAGECGSIWNKNYIGAGNVWECIVFGRIAGENAAAEISWD